MKLEMREIYCEIWKKQTIKQELCKNTLTKKKLKLLFQLKTTKI